MMMVNGKQMYSYFLTPNENSKVMIFNNFNSTYSFIGRKTKAPGIKAVVTIVAGLNHVFSWAYDTERTRFINKLEIFFLGMYHKIISQDFIEENLRSVRDCRFQTIAQASAFQFKKIIANMDDDIIQGVVEYIHENTYVPPAEELEKEKNRRPTDKIVLDREDLFLITCLITLTKMMLPGVALLESYALEKYIYEPLINLIPRIQMAMADFYYYQLNERGDVYNKIINTDYKDQLYSYFTEGLVDEFQKNEPLMGIFESNAQSIPLMVDEKWVTGITTIHKCIPIEVKNKQSNEYMTGDNYWEYKFVDRNTSKYISETIRRMARQKTGVNFAAVISPVTASVGESDSYNSIAKHELFLEKKSLSDMEKRRKHIRLIRAYCKDKIETYGLTIEDDCYPVKNPLADFFIIKLLAEVSEDSLSLKLLDKRTYISLVLVISHRMAKDYKILSQAMKSNQVSPNFVNKTLDKYMDKVTRIKKYHINPKKTEESLQKILNQDYKNTRKNMIFNITEEFINFLIEDQAKEYLLINDAYIYDYEKELENLDKIMEK